MPKFNGLDNKGKHHIIPWELEDIVNEIAWLCESDNGFLLGDYTTDYIVGTEEIILQPKQGIDPAISIQIKVRES